MTSRLLHQWNRQARAVSVAVVLDKKDAIAFGILDLVSSKSYEQYAMNPSFECYSFALLVQSRFRQITPEASWSCLFLVFNFA